MNVAEDFENLQDRLFAIAYRMLGTVTDAEDVIQETFVRWTNTDQTKVENPGAYLRTITTRLSIDRLKARQKEEYVGPWLPEPLVTDKGVERAESLTMAFLVLLEKLQPLERAVFLLTQVFDYRHDEVGKLLDLSVVNSRKLLQRAREHLNRDQLRFQSSVKDSEQVAGRFVEAIQTGDMEHLLGLLRKDITLWSDGGGRVPAARIPLEGNDRVATFLIRIAQQLGDAPSVQFAWINSEPGIIIRMERQIESVFVLEIDGDQVANLRIVRNPEKLRHLTKQSERH